MLTSAVNQLALGGLDGGVGPRGVSARAGVVGENLAEKFIGGSCIRCSKKQERSST